MRHVVVTTDKRGVFFGELTNHDKAEKTVDLKDAQMCVYWTEETRGVLGLAATGPLKGCKTTPIIPGIFLNEVTSVMDVTPEAAKAWKEMPWD